MMIYGLFLGIPGTDFFYDDTLHVGWETIFEVLGSVCRPAPSDPASYLTLPRHLGHLALIKIAFLCMTLMCDVLAVLSPEHLRLCISTLGQFGWQVDTNIALMAAESLFWGVSDVIQAKRCKVDHEPVDWYFVWAPSGK